MKGINIHRNKGSFYPCLLNSNGFGHGRFPLDSDDDYLYECDTKRQVM